MQTKPPRFAALPRTAAAWIGAGSARSGDRPAKALLVTCTDTNLDAMVNSRVRSGSLMLLRTPGNRIPPFFQADREFSEAIEQAVMRAGVTQIIVCGHSHCSGSPVSRDGAILERVASEEPDTWYDRMRRRIADAACATRQARNDVPAQLANLGTYPRIADALLRGSVSLYGLFYVVESGAFLQYMETCDQFVPVLGGPTQPPMWAERIAWG